jgi:VWFA-related protein
VERIMRRVIAAALLGSLGILPLAAQAPPLRSGVDFIQVDVVALDAAGSPVAGLAKSDFELRVGGRAVPIETFTAVESGSAGRLMVLVLDDLSVAPTDIARTKDIARAFVAKMGPGDEMAVVSFDGVESANHGGFWGKATASAQTTADTRALVERIEQLKYRGPVLNPYHIGEFALDTIGSVAAQLGAVQGRRKSIVCVGSEDLFDIREPGPGAATKLRPEWIEAERAAAAANVSVYVIDPFGLRNRADSRATGFARETGGQAFANNFFDRTVDRIWRESGAYYLLGFDAATAGKGASPRPIDVRVARRGIEIKSRRSVVLP